MLKQVLIFLPFLIGAVLSSEQLDLAKQRIQAIKRDDNNISYTAMINQVVMPKYTLSSHEDNSSYFYTDKREIVSEIISMVVEKPHGVMNKNSEGVIGIYRDFDFERDLSSLFIKERRMRGGYDGYHLGTTAIGPTNRVVVFLKTSDPSTKSMMQFIEAYPQ